MIEPSVAGEHPAAHRLCEYQIQAVVYWATTTNPKGKSRLQETLGRVDPHGNGLNEFEYTHGLGFCQRAVHCDLAL
jgi:hypothetical protein